MGLVRIRQFELKKILKQNIMKNTLFKRNYVCGTFLEKLQYNVYANNNRSFVVKRILNITLRREDCKKIQL